MLRIDCRRFGGGSSSSSLSGGIVDAFRFDPDRVSMPCIGGSVHHRQKCI